MEFSSPHLTFDPRATSLDQEVENLCGMRLDILDELVLEAQHSGSWWVYPLGRSMTFSLIGIRLSPGRSLAQSPVVICEGSEAVTLCSSSAYLVPALLAIRLIAGESRWSQIAALSADGWRRLVTFHRALGGTDDLDSVRSVAADPALRHAMTESEDHARWIHAVAEIRRRVDEAPETQTWAAYAASVAVDESVSDLPPESGCWSPALDALALVACQNDLSGERRRDLELGAAWRVIHHPPALDTSRTDTGILPPASSTASIELGTAAAKMVTWRRHEEWAADPLVTAAEQLATARPYDGAAHLAAASALERAGHHEAAFTALTAAAYWSFHARGEATPETLNSAIGVAKNAGSTDVAEALEQMLAAREMLEAEWGDMT